MAGHTRNYVVLFYFSPFVPMPWRDLESFFWCEAMGYKIGLKIYQSLQNNTFDQHPYKALKTSPRSGYKNRL